MDELDPEVNQAVLEGLGIIDWLYEQIHETEVTYENHMPCVLYYVSMQHSVGALLLLKNMAHAPAFALTRSIYETFVRALWLKVLATEADKARAQRDNFPKLFDIINQLRQMPEAAPIVRRFRLNKLLNSFTHGGLAQIQGHLGGAVLAPQFPKANQLALVDWAVRIAIVSAIHFAASIGRGDLGVGILENLPDGYRPQRSVPVTQS